MAYSNEEISEIIQEFMEAVGTRQYIGSRYVPILGRKGEDSIVWDNTDSYEPLTIVLYQGNSYTSRQFVPAGVDILNTEFWANTGNYNAQIEQYRLEVQNLGTTVEQNTQAISDLNDDVEQVKTDIESLGSDVDANAQSIETLNGTVSQNTSAITTLTSSVEQNTSAISTITSNVEQNTTDIGGLRDSVATNAAGIAANTQSIGEINTELDSITESIETGLSTVNDRVDTVSFGDTLIFGDSWNFMNDADQLWVTMFKNYASRHGFNVYNHAVAGSGYRYSNYLFSTQVTNATETDVKNVIVLGGLNDVRSTNYNQGEFWTSVRALLTQIQTKWPDANVYVAGVQHGNSNYEPKYTSATKTLALAANISGCMFAAANHWLPSTDLYTDSLHPNDNGHKVVFTRMMQLLGLGGTNGAGYVKNVSYTVESGGTVSAFNASPATMIDGHFNFMFSMSGSVNANSTLTVRITGLDNMTVACDMPMICGGNADVYAHGYMFTNGNIRVLIKNTSGSALNFNNLYGEINYSI